MTNVQLCAHEIFTPLFAIDGAIEMLLDGSVGELSNECSTLLQDASSASRTLNRQLALLIEIARLGHQPAGYKALYQASSIGSTFAFDVPPECQHLTFEIDMNAMSDFVLTLQEMKIIDDISRFFDFERENLSLEIPTASDTSGGGDGSLSSFLVQAFAIRIGFDEIKISRDKIHLSAAAVMAPNRV